MKYRVKTILFAILFLATSYGKLAAQTIEDIVFHLYTDSLKKGSWYYINVDAKLSNGKWKPLTHHEVIFTVSGGKLEGNSLWVDWDFSADSVHITATLKENSNLRKATTLWVKKFDPQLQYNLPVKNIMLSDSATRKKQKQVPRTRQ